MAKSFESLSEEELIASFLAADPREYRLKLPAHSAGKAMLSADVARRARIVVIAIDRLRTKKHDPLKNDDDRLRRIISDVLRAKTTGKEAVTPDVLAPVIAAAARIGRTHRQFEYFPRKSLVNVVEKVVKKQGLTPALRKALEAWRSSSSPRKLTATEEAELRRAEAIAFADDAPWEQAGPAFDKIERFKELTSPLKAEREVLARLNKLLGARVGG